METQTIEFRAAAGLTLTVELFAIGSDAIVDTESATEQTNRAGTYRAAFTDVAAGEYQLVAFSGTTPVASWLVTLTLATATFQVYDRATSVNMRGTDNAALASNYNATRAGYLDKLNVSGTLAHSNDAATYKATGFAVAGDAMTLTSGEREATAVVVESHLLDEGDSQMLINAIVGAIGNTNIDQAVLIAAIRADLERSGGNLNTLITRIAGTIRTAADDVTAETAQTAAIRDGLALEATAQSIKGKTDGLTFTVENQVDVNVKSYNGTSQSNGDLPLKIDAVKSVVDSIVAKTDNLPESPAATSDVQVTVEPEITVNPTTLDSGERAEIATAVWAKELSEGNTAASFVMRLTSGFASLITNLAAMITGSGAEAKYTVLALENGPSGEGSGLTGPYTRTITITDSVSSLPVQNATVRFYRTGYTESKATNSSGVASFTVEAAVWSYAIIADGYIGQSDNVTVGASGDTPISLVLRSPVEVTADTTALTFRVSSQGNASLAGVVASAKLIGEGYTVVGETVGINVIEEDTSDAEGMVTLVLFRESDYDLSVKRTNGTTYKLRIRTSDEATTTISAAIEV
jgi:hypothetical protein